MGLVKFKLVETLSEDKYYRIEALDEDREVVGGLFRGLNNLINQLYYDDNPFYDNLNDPLSELEYETTFPKGFNQVDAVFAYKEDKYLKLRETILDLKAELNQLGWDLDIKEINRPSNIVYEDDEQIAYIPDGLTEGRKKKSKKNKIVSGVPIFTSINDLKSWVKKRQKGWGSFVHIDNCGNMDYNNAMFNRMNGTSNNCVSSADSSTTTGESSGADGGAALGGASTGMGESLQLISEKNKQKQASTVVNELIWYQLPSGRMPAKEFYEESSDRIQAMFDRYFISLKNNSLSAIKDASKLLDSKERIFELRVKDGEHWARITYTRINGNSILLLGFNKYQNQTPKIEIEKSIKYKKDYIKNKLGELADVG